MADNLEALRTWVRERRRRRLSRGGSLGRFRAQLSLLISLAVLAGTVIWSLAYLAPAPEGEEVSLDQLAVLIEGRAITEATFNDEDAQVIGVARRDGAFWTSYPRSDATTADLIATLAESGAEVRVDPQPGKAVVRLLVTVLLPLMILANLFALFLTWSRGGGQGLGELQDFSAVGDKRVAKGTGPAVGFHEVAGIDDVVVELREVVDYLANPERYEELGAAPPKGVLLFGPPGVGKTLLAKAVAGEAGVPFFSVAGAEFVESLVGVGAARVRDLFRRVRAVAPAIVFIDELDAAGRRRGGSSTGGTDEREQTLNQLLVEMDGFDVDAGIVVIAATNRPDILDPALLRPGRFDRHITIEKPDVEAREAILRLHAGKRRRVAASVDFHDIARRTPGFSGADLANVVNEAALLTIRQGAQTITEAEFNEAILRVVSGPRRRGHLMSEDERTRVAVHEAGHAVVASLLGWRDDVHHVSIVSQGGGIGATVLSRDEDRAVLAEGQLRAQLVVSLAGAAAEDLVLGEPSTAAEDDLARVTDLARDMVGRYGMSDLGRLRLLSSDASRYLGEAEAVGALSAPLHEAFDTEVARTVEHAFATARDALKVHRDDLDRLVGALIERESLEGPALLGLLPATAANGSAIDLRRKKVTRSRGAARPKTPAT